MKQIYSTIILMLVFSLLATNVKAQKNKNYALYSLEESRFLCVSYDEKSVFCLEENDEAKKILVQRDLITGEILQSFKTKFPASEIDHARISENLIYISTFKEIEGERTGSFDGIYSINLKNQKLKKIVVFKEKIYQLRSFYLVGDLLVFSPYSRGKQRTILYNIKKKTSEDLSITGDYKILFAAKEKNGLFFIQENQSGEEVIEEVVEEIVEEIVEEAVEEAVEATENNDLLGLFFCDFAKSNKITKIGAYQPDAVYSTNPDESKFPYAVIENENYEWFTASFNQNRYPSSVVKAADNTELIEAYQKLDNYEYINSVYLIQNEFFIAFNYWLKTLAVYNIKTPQTVKKSNLTKEQAILIDAFISERFSYTKEVIDSAALAEVFDAKFYKITEKVLDTWGSSSTQGLAIEFKGKFKVLREKKELTILVKKGFKLKIEENALFFEKALDALYPLNVFDEKKKEHFLKDGKWYFVREESFDVKRAICVELDDKGRIVKINNLKDVE